MTLPNWITRTQASAAPPSRPRSREPQAAFSSAGSLASHGAENHVQPDTRKSGSTERRQLLSTALRDAMLSAGLLPADYKAKAWSMDRSGSQFLVLMNVAGHFDGDAHRLSSLEKLIAEAAKTRFDITVTGVYWRIDLQKTLLPATAHRPAVPVEAATPAPAPALLPSIKQSAEGTVSAVPAPAVSKQPLSSRMREIFAPIEAGEVAAFRRAKAKAAGDRNAGAEDEESTY